jgi:hypothetical protein
LFFVFPFFLAASDPPTNLATNPHNQQGKILPVGPSALASLTMRHPVILRPPEQQVDPRDLVATKRKQDKANFQKWLDKKQQEFVDLGCSCSVLSLTFLILFDF